MKLGLVILSLSLAAVGLAQDSQEQKAMEAKRLTSVTWDAMSGKLVWVVQKGVTDGENFVPSSEEERYEISPDDAVMAFQGNERGFTPQEAEWLQGLLRALSVYCAESTVWWDHGQGKPMDKNHPTVQRQSEQPAPPAPVKEESPENAPQKISVPQSKPAPGAVRLVAMRMVQ